MPQVEQGRRMFGCFTYVGCMGLGAAMLVLVFVLLPAALRENMFERFEAMLLGAVLAFPMAVVYLIIPRALDRYDPEPAYALILALGWGAIAAVGVSAFINTGVSIVLGPGIGDVVAACISAPLVEEATKGILIVGFLYFLRREFDGVVDGIIYGTFVAIGFAAVENVIYYMRADMSGELFGTFFIRGVLGPWGHPLYTSMTGIGVGIARETDKRWLRFVAPVLGYSLAVFLHFCWNASATFMGLFDAGPLVFLFILLPMWFIFLALFIGMVMFLVRRRGKIIRAHLLDEVALGHLSQSELDLVVSMFGGVVAFFRKGRKGSQFVRAVARLALSKWHSRRAVKMSSHTVSMDFVVPMRKKVQALRAQGASPALGPPPRPSWQR